MQRAVLCINRSKLVKNAEKTKKAAFYLPFWEYFYTNRPFCITKTGLQEISTLYHFYKKESPACIYLIQTGQVVPTKFISAKRLSIEKVDTFSAKLSRFSKREYPKGEGVLFVPRGLWPASVVKEKESKRCATNKIE